MNRTSTRTNEARNELDNQVLALITQHTFATRDGDGHIGPKGLAWATGRTLPAIKASLTRLVQSERVTYIQPGPSAPRFYTPTARR